MHGVERQTPNKAADDATVDRKIIGDMERSFPFRMIGRTPLLRHGVLG
jgi:hypothetical protein